MSNEFLALLLRIPPARQVTDLSMVWGTGKTQKCSVNSFTPE